MDENIKYLTTQPGTWNRMNLPSLVKRRLRR
jgi:hypothetical protein